jgi:hypothetical protein
MDLGNKVHYDQLNGVPGTVGAPSELQARYPNSMFIFTKRGAAGPDVEWVGGPHPSDASVYPTTTWKVGNNFGDFKPDTVNGIKALKKDIRSGKSPVNTEFLPYDPKTGKLK